MRKGVLIVISGFSGAGKGTITKKLLENYDNYALSISMTTRQPRPGEVDGNRQYFARNLENPLEADAVIVDELSMVDTHLFASLLNALPLGCRLIMVGDSDQLPPVGAGNVLQDIITSELLPTVCLTEVFRQALESLIVTNAHKIVKGEYPDLSRNDKDFFFMSRPNVYTAADVITELYTARLPYRPHGKPSYRLGILPYL